ncbi:hypothetical protein CR513_21913, partial [Mucuna pruriens]
MRTLLDESIFEVFSDHRSLKHSLEKKKLKMRQCKWLEFLKDYSFDLSHHLGKANVVVNALSRNSLDLKDSSLVCEVTLNSMKLGMLKVTNDLMEESTKGQKLGLVITHENMIDVKIRIDKLTTHYLEEIARIHGVPLSVVYDRNLEFTLRSWESCFEP